jgi:hypothetical protein
MREFYALLLSFLPSSLLLPPVFSDSVRSCLLPLNISCLVQGMCRALSAVQSTTVAQKWATWKKEKKAR